MVNMDAMMLQRMLEQEENVSLAWLQGKLEMTYGEVCRLSALLHKRGWLGEEGPDGYKVGKAYLLLRELRKVEAGRLVDQLTSDCLPAMELLREHQVEGVDFKALEKAIRGTDDTQAAIEILLGNRLIFVSGNYYFLRISRKAAEVIIDMLTRKRLMERREAVNRDRLIACFDELFED